ncbi:unnamed protein product [Amoebophrya sp. A120]|nr:unnamed protein product [Amoebophrya sp. A120]|eukprot:GSA120T00005740001.1
MLPHSTRRVVRFLDGSNVTIADKSCQTRLQLRNLAVAALPEASRLDPRLRQQYPPKFYHLFPADASNYEQENYTSSSLLSTAPSPRGDSEVASNTNNHVELAPKLSAGSSSSRKMSTASSAIARNSLLSVIVQDEDDHVQVAAPPLGRTTRSSCVFDEDHFVDCEEGEVASVQTLSRNRRRSRRTSIQLRDSRRNSTVTSVEDESDDEYYLVWRCPIAAGNVIPRSRISGDNKNVCETRTSVDHYADVPDRQPAELRHFLDKHGVSLLAFLEEQLAPALQLEEERGVFVPAAEIREHLQTVGHFLANVCDDFSYQKVADYYELKLMSTCARSFANANTATTTLRAGKGHGGKTRSRVDVYATDAIRRVCQVCVPVLRTM